ncbi:MAG: flagellar basal body L-ring protein FlgH [Pseudomonadota bacterium]
MRTVIISYFLCALFLSGCSETLDKLKRVGKGPSMTQMNVPTDSRSMIDEESLKIQRKARIRHTNSLWQPGSTTFFRDTRAWQVGDILKVVVVIQDSAQLNNSTSQSRKGNDNTGITSLFGKEKPIAKTLKVANLNPILGTTGDHKYDGLGGISRKENIRTEIAAVVTQVLPNGNLVIQGHQEVKVNHELREIKIAGVIRSKDVSSDNSIQSEQIAEARISYGGRGLVTDMQQPRLGAQVVDIISPF